MLTALSCAFCASCVPVPDLLGKPHKVPNLLESLHRLGGSMTTAGIHRFILVFAAALVSCPLAAQEVTGNITGAVTDASGAAVPNARVTVTATAQGLVLRALETNEVGLYSATLLPVGTYSVTVEAGGFKKATRGGIELDANAK